MPSLTTPPPVAGSVVGGLVVLDEIGRGAENIIYRARRDGKTYALKVLRRADAGDRAARDFRREAAMLASLHHPGLVRIHEVGENDGRPYLLMELLRGQTLRSALDARPIWTEAEAVRLAHAAAGALAAAHRAGLVHRDVKPENIFITVDDETKVIDFGLAAQAGVHQDADAVIGTALYSPPEQTGMLNRAVDGRSDLYSLGVVLFEVVAGRRPFESSDVGDLIRQHAVRTPPDLRTLRTALSPVFVAIIERSLAKDPDDRYQTGEGLLADLDRLARHHDAAVDGGPPADFPVGLADDPAAVMHDLPLIGRHPEFAELRSSWRQTLADGGGVVLVEGEPGQGKSRLGRELCRLAGAEGALVLTGKAIDGSPIPLAGLRDALHGHLRRLGGLPPDAHAEAEGRLLRAAEGSGGMLATFSPALAALIGQGAVPDHDEDRQDQYFAAISRFLTKLATEHDGAVLCIDDVQWLDQASLRVMQTMAAGLSDAPLLVIGTARNDEASRAGTERFCVDVGDALRTRIVLRPLDEAGVAALIREQFGGPVTDPDVARRLHTRGNGNPFATVEYLRAVLDAGLVSPSWGTFVVDTAGLDQLDLPANVIDLVLRRADDLGADARALLTTGAAVGSRFRPGTLHDILGIDAPRLAAAVAEALRVRLIERTLGDGAEYAFVHDRIREAMLDPLDEGQMSDLHQRLGESFETLDDTGPDHVLALARHFALGTGATPEKVYRWNEAAGQVAHANYAVAEASAFYARAAEAAEQAGIAVDSAFEETFGITMLWSGDFEGSYEHFLKALGLTSEPWARTRIHTQLARAELGRWNTLRSWDHVQEGLQAVGWALPSNPASFWFGTAQRAFQGIFSTLTHRGFGAAEGDERMELENVIGLHETGSTVSFCTARPLMMAALLFRALPLVNRLGETRELVRVYAKMSLLAGSTGQIRLVDKILDRAMEVAEKLEDPFLVAGVHLCRAYSYELAGEPERAAEQADTLLHEHGRWLDIEDLLSAASGHPISRDLRGLTGEAYDLWMTAHERTLLSNRPGATANPYLFVGFTLYAALGRTSEAARQLQLADDAMVGADTGRLRRAGLVERKLRYMLELDDLDGYDDVVAEADAIGLSPLTTAFWMKGIFVWPAHAAVERLRRATPEERPGRLAEARKRIRREPGVTGEPIFRAYRAAHGAALAQIEHHDRTALRLAAKAEKLAIRAAAPAVHFEIACVRARVAAGMGQRFEAARQAETAVALADRYGWIGRGRLVRNEFGDLVDSVPRSGATSTSVTRSSATGRSIAPGTTYGSQLRRDRSLDALLALSTAAAQVNDPDELARVALDQLVAQLGAERAFLFLAGDDGKVTAPSAARNADGEDLVGVTDYASTVVERVMAEHEALVVTGTEEGAAIGSESTVAHGLRSILAAPLMLEGRFLGVVYLDSRLAKGIFTTEDVEILAAISNHIAISIETARSTRLELAVTSEREKRGLAEALRDSMTVVSSTLEPVAVLERTLDMTARVLDFDRAVALLRQDGRWSIAAVAGDLDLHRAVEAGVDLDRDTHLASLTGNSVGTVVSNEDGTRPGASAALLDLLGGPASRLSVPLSARGALIGVLLIAVDMPAELAEAKLELAATIAAQGVVAYENARLFKAVERLAVIDDLSRLNNRRQFFTLGETAFGLALRYRRPMAAIMVDIDHFKRVNDTYGHAAGDEVIRIVAARLSATVREIDIIGRYGGEEFAVILPETDEDVMVVAGRLCRTIGADPILTDAGLLAVHISVGVATMTDDDTTLAALLARADAALYTAKAEGRNRVVLAV